MIKKAVENKGEPQEAKNKALSNTFKFERLAVKLQKIRSNMKMAENKPLMKAVKNEKCCRKKQGENRAEKG